MDIFLKLNLLYNDLDPLGQIVENTQPLYIYNFNLLWWSFGVAIASLLAGIFAALYSYMGYRFQRISAQHLDAIAPGQMSYYEIVGSLLNNLLDIESIYFGHKSYQQYPLKLILSTAKLPCELIHIEKYEKDKQCYDEAFKLNISWQNYNNYIDLLIEYSTKNSDANKVCNLAQHIIDITKEEIVLVQHFENYLYNRKYIQEKTATNEKISWYLCNRFFETLNELSSEETKDFDSSRSNLSKETLQHYIYCPYLPNNLDEQKYLQSEHKNKLTNVGEGYASFFTYDPQQIIQALKEGEYNDLLNGLVKLPKGSNISDINFSDFHSCYFNYIEPILIGYKRYEHAHIF